MTTTDEPTPQATPGEQQVTKLTFPYFESAIVHNNASFSQVAEALFLSQNEFNPEPETRLLYANYYPKLLKAFEAKHGATIESYFCSKIIGAAALTSQGELFVVYRARSGSEVEELLFRCNSISTKAHQLLRGRDLGTCVESLYAVAGQLLGILEADADKRKQADRRVNLSRVLAILKREVGNAETFYTRAAQRNAQINYFRGMLAGFAALALTAAVLRIGLALFRTTTFVLLGSLLGSLIAGSLGAVVSVMSRMAFGRLVLNYEAGDKLLQLLGGFRPVIGAIFGAALHVIVASGLLPIKVPTEAVEQLFFYASIAFIAGFSERWAQDMLVASRRRIMASAGGGGQEQEEDKAGSAPAAPK